MRKGIPLAATAVAFAVSACSAPVATPRWVAGRLVPWAQLQGIQGTRPLTIPGIAACSINALDIAVGIENPSYVNAGPQNTSTWGMHIRNTSSTACFVGPTVDIAFQTAAGRLNLENAHVGTGDIIYLAPSSGSPDTAPYTDQAIGEIDSWGSCALPRITSMVISPGPGLGSTIVKPGLAGGTGTPCPGGGSYIAELWPDLDTGGTLANAQARIVAPRFVHPGEELRYVVTIDDTREVGTGQGPPPPQQPVTLEPCPAYHEELEGVTGAAADYRLNCAQASPIAPLASERFEMVLDIPNTARPGPAVLLWSIDDPSNECQDITSTSTYVSSCSPNFSTARAFVEILP